MSVPVIAQAPRIEHQTLKSSSEKDVILIDWRTVKGPNFN